jgi:hypothetical protein
VQPVRVALARYAAEFAEIDDPRALDFAYAVPVNVGEIAVFVSDVGEEASASLNCSPDWRSPCRQPLCRIALAYLFEG